MTRPRTALALASALVISLVMVPSVAAKKKKNQPLPSPVNAISRGDADGPLAAELGPDGSLHVVFTEKASEEEAPVLVHRVRSVAGIWGEAETVMGEIPSAITLAVTSSGPVIVYSRSASGSAGSPGATSIAIRTDEGWEEKELAPAEERPLPPVVTGTGDDVRVLILLRGDGEGPSRIRRIPIGRDDATTEYEVPGAVVERFAATADKNRDHVFLSQASQTLQIRSTGGRKMDIAPAAAFRYGSLGRRLSPLSVLPARGEIQNLVMASAGREPALVWTTGTDQTEAGAGVRHQLFYLTRTLGRFGGAKSILETREAITAIDIESRGSLVVVAIIAGDQLMVRFRRGVFWEKWVAPPGMDRVLDFAPEAIDLVLDDRNRALVLTRERLRSPLVLRRIVEWTLLPTIISP